MACLYVLCKLVEDNEIQAPPMRRVLHAEQCIGSATIAHCSHNVGATASAASTTQASSALSTGSTANAAKRIERYEQFVPAPGTATQSSVSHASSSLSGNGTESAPRATTVRYRQTEYTKATLPRDLCAQKVYTECCAPKKRIEYRAPQKFAKHPTPM
jgi:hypothetical protein